MDDDGSGCLAILCGLFLALVIGAGIGNLLYGHGHPREGCPVCEKINAAQAEVDRIKQGTAAAKEGGGAA